MCLFRLRGWFFFVVSFELWRKCRRRDDEVGSLWNNGDVRRLAKHGMHLLADFVGFIIDALFYFGNFSCRFLRVLMCKEVSCCFVIPQNAPRISGIITNYLHWNMPGRWISDWINEKKPSGVVRLHDYAGYDILLVFNTVPRKSVQTLGAAFSRLFSQKPCLKFYAQA